MYTYSLAERTQGNQQWNHARSTGQNCEGRQEGGDENKECLGGRVQKNESLEAESMEY